MGSPSINEVIDIKKLKGKELFYFFTHDYKDKDYASVIALLMDAVGEVDEAYSLLERVVIENKKFIAVYPSIEDVDTSSMEYVGSIMDGGLYIE